MPRRGIDVAPSQIEEWRHDLVSFRNVYVEYLNKTLGDREAPQKNLALRSQVMRAATPAQTAMNAIGAGVSWLPPPAAGGPVLSGLVNMVFIHESVHGYAGGMFGTGGQPYQAIIDVVDSALASLDRLERAIRRKRKNPLYWVDRGLRLVLGIPAYLVSLIFGVPVERIEASPLDVPLRLLGLVVEGLVVYFGGHEAGWW